MRKLRLRFCAFASAGAILHAFTFPSDAALAAGSSDVYVGG